MPVKLMPIKPHFGVVKLAFRGAVVENLLLFQLSLAESRESNTERGRDGCAVVVGHSVVVGGGEGEMAAGGEPWERSADQMGDVRWWSALVGMCGGGGRWGCCGGGEMAAGGGPWWSQAERRRRTGCVPLP